MRLRKHTWRVLDVSRFKYTEAQLWTMFGFGLCIGAALGVLLVFLMEGTWVN